MALRRTASVTGPGETTRQPVAPVKPVHADEVGAHHESWLERRIYAKTVLGTARTCLEKFRLTYEDPPGRTNVWGSDLVEGITFHALVEAFHKRQIEGMRPLTAVELMQTWDEAWQAREHMLEYPVRDVPAKRKRAIDAYHLWVRTGVQYYLTVEGAEEVFGIKTPVYMGGARIAGHTDLRVCRTAGRTQTMYDFKFCSQKSRHRNRADGTKTLRFDLGMEMYFRAFPEVGETAIIPVVKDLVEPKIDKPVFVNHDKGTAELADEIVRVTVENIESGRRDNMGVEVGSPHGLCNPKWCSFFGRECRFTRMLNREDYL